MTSDPYAWLEEIDSDAALEWVRARNGERAADLAALDGFAETGARVRAILDSQAKIPYVARVGDFYYNFWTDAEHERGLWRRTSWESYLRAEPEWETVLDLDALSAAEGENWVWHGASIFRGDEDYRLAMVTLSRGGADADESREFDLHRKEFVADGFLRPEAKGGESWIDADTLLVCTDTGPGSLTSSGYPREVRRWRRGTSPAEAELIYACGENDMMAFGWHSTTPGFERTFVGRRPDFWTSEVGLWAPEGLRIIEAPASAEEDVHREWLTLTLREDWTVGDRTYPAGALLAARLEDHLAGDRDLQVLYEPSDRGSLLAASWTRDHLVVTTLEDVKHRVQILTPGAEGFARASLGDLPDVGTVSVGPVDPRHGNDVWLTVTDFLTPTTLARATVCSDGASVPVPLKSAPAFFDAGAMVAEQHFARSADGTRVPYFLVRAADLPTDGSTPTLLSAYGGFEVSLTPSYSGIVGTSWLARGGAYAVANIRGGGEYGPAWHQAALRENRHRAYEDLAAVARDLADRGVADPSRLGVQGGSNGGLLTGNMLTQYPELFGAVVIRVPLLDMKRYSHLLAGASWMAEYGDPDVAEDWAFLRTFSPYHLFDPDRDYPPVLLTTSTRDDRVHPAHARKMAALMLAAGKDVTYYENIEGGHGGAATNAQAAHMEALVFSFLWERLGR